MKNESNADDFELSLPILLPCVAVAVAVVAVAVTGNTLVLASYVRDPKLRTVSNLYLLHMAVCDLLLAAISMPFRLIYSALDLTWPLGSVFCKMYLANDYTLCAMSVMIMILVSLDQLLILRLGVFYVTKETRIKAYVKLTVAWLFSFLLYGPAILGWDVWTGRSVLDKNECDVEFRDNEVYTLVTACLEFFLPAVILASLNLTVYYEIRKRTKVGTQGSISATIAKSSVHASGIHQTCSGLPVQGEGSREQAAAALGDAAFQIKASRNDGLCTGHGFYYQHDVQGVVPEGLQKAITPGCSLNSVPPNETDPGANAKFGDLHSEPYTLDTNDLLNRQPPPSALGRKSNLSILKTIAENNGHGRFDTSNSAKGQQHNSDLCSVDPATTQTQSTPCFRATSTTEGSDHVKAELERHVRKNLKAARALFVFVFAFVLLWAPYTVTTVIVAFCNDCVNLYLFEFFTWWLWFKSAVNPFIYAANNARFKDNFKQILDRMYVRCR